MNPCYMWDDGYRVRLCAETGPASAGAALLVTGLIEELSSVVEPLALGAAFACYDVSEFPAATGAFPPMSFSTLYREVVPSYVRRREYSAVDQAAAAAALTPDVVKSWLTQALKQQCADGRSLTGLRRLEMSSARARLSSPFAADVFPLLSYPRGPELASIPIEEEVDGRWIYAPIQEAVFDPPVTYQVSTQYGALTATLAIHWSWWFEPGSAEFDTTSRALQRILAAGWSYESPADASVHDPYGLTEL